MKKILLLLFVTSIAFMSCSKDEDEVIYDKANIVGTWKGEKVLIDGEYNEEALGATLTLPKYEFKTDGTGLSILYGLITTKITWSLSENKVLTITEEGETISVNITELTKSRLVFNKTEDGKKYECQYKKQ